MSLALIGDCKEAQEVAREIYGDVITIEDAQCLTDMLTKHMGWPRVKVSQGRQAMNQHGSISKVTSSAPHMTLNKPSVGVVIHELAHMAHRDTGTRTSLHNHTFKSAQRYMLRVWLGK